MKSILKNFPHNKILFETYNNLTKVHIIKDFIDKEIFSLTKKVKKITFKKKDIIIQSGNKNTYFYLIAKGRVKMKDPETQKTIRIYDEGNCFGELSILNETANSNNFIASENTICYLINSNDFFELLKEQNANDYLKSKMLLEDNDISLNDLYYISYLGRGRFGNVCLVHNKICFYAAKAVSRLAAEKQKTGVKNLLNEKKTMLTLDHPFIVKMVKSMKNSKFCFLLLEYVNGKNLDEYLSSRLNKKNLKETQFFAGSLFLMLEYLQKKFIAHRDIKPSNIMIDGNGYLKMIDFGTAKILTDYTSTVIGTPHYIPPEILQGKGYSLSCDFWSVGVCIYEIFYGSYPFGNYVTEVIEIYKEILNKKFFNLSKNPQYTNLNNLIKALLNKKVNERLCNIHTIKKSDFFKNFNFSELIDFKLTPPYIPTTKEANLNLNDKNEKYEDYMNKNCVDEGYERYYDEDVPVDYDQNWADEF